MSAPKFGKQTELFDSVDPYVAPPIDPIRALELQSLAPSAASEARSRRDGYEELGYVFSTEGRGVNGAHVVPLAEAKEAASQPARDWKPCPHCSGRGRVPR